MHIGIIKTHPVAPPLLTTSTAAATAAKTCTETNTNFTTNLTAGTHILLKFEKGNSAASPTLSINGAAAKSITGGTGSAKPAQFNYTNAMMHLVYDGTSWIIVG